jgi:hypothetical protein
VCVYSQKSSGPKTRLPKVSKSSTSSVQEDFEIEIAEVLYGLKKQSPNSYFSRTSTLSQNNTSASDTLIGLGESI